MMKLKKRLMCFWIVFCLILSTVPNVHVLAEGDNSPSLTVYMGQSTVSAGSSFNVFLQANSFSNVGGFQVELHYDSDSFELVDAWTEWFLDGQTNVIKTDVPGEVNISSICLDGLSGSGELVGCCFVAKQDVTPGEYTFDLLVREVYTPNFETVTVRKIPGSILVEKKQSVVKHIQFYSQTSTEGYQEGLVQYDLFGYDLQNFASGNLVFSFDSSALAFREATLGTGLQADTAVHLVNDKNKDRVVVSYVNELAVPDTSEPLMHLVFQVLKDAEESTLIQMEANNLFDVDGNTMLSDGCKSTVYLHRKAGTVDYPDLSAQVVGDAKTGQFTVNVVLEGASGVAAGDFSVTYDPDVLQAVEVKTDSTVSAKGGQIVTNPKIDGGIIKYSFINVNGISEDQVMIHITFVSRTSEEVETTISVLGSGVVDSNEKSVMLDFPETRAVVGPSSFQISGSITFDDKSDDLVRISLFQNDTLVKTDDLVPVSGKADYQLTGIAAGDYTLKVEKSGYLIAEYEITVVGDNVVQDVALIKELAVDEKSPTSIALTKGYSAYRIADLTTNPTNEWVTTNTFTGLYPNTEYVLYAQDSSGETYSIQAKTDSIADYSASYIDDKTVNITTKFGYSCSFHNNIAINYYVLASDLEGCENVRLYIEKQNYAGAGDECSMEPEILTEYTMSTVSGKQYYRFAYKGIKSWQMGSTVYATVYANKDGQAVIGQMETYGIKTYAKNRLANSQDAQFKTLLVDMLNYGAASQQYFGRNTGNLVNADLSDEQRALGTQEDVVLTSASKVNKIESPIATIKQASVVFGNNIELKYYFTIPVTYDINSTTFELTYSGINGNNKYVTFTKEMFSEEKQLSTDEVQCYSVKCIDLAAYDLGSVISATVKDNGTVISHTVEYSVESYAFNRLNASTDENFKALLRSMMKYSRAAKAYFEN